MHHRRCWYWYWQQPGTVWMLAVETQIDLLVELLETGMAVGVRGGGCKTKIIDSPRVVNDGTTRTLELEWMFWNLDQLETN